MSEQGHNVAPTSDGGYIMVGLATSTDGDVTGNHGSNDYWVVKTDAAGTLQWQKSYGGSGDDKAYSVRQTSDGGYIVAGSASSIDGDVTGNHGSLDFWVIKLDNSGNLVWQKALGGTGAEAAYNVIETYDGGYAVVGLETSTNGDVTGNHGSFDYWFCKLDASGTLVWQKTLGGSGTDQAFGVVQMEDTGYVICGYSSSTNGDVTNAHGSNDYWIVKIDKTGTLVWEHTYGGTGSDRGFNIDRTFDGGVIVNGVSPSTDGDVTGNHGDNDYWLIKLDATGSLEWQHSFGGTGDDFGRSVQQTIDSGYILGGRSNTPNNGDVTGNHGLYDYWVVKLLKDGTLQWEQSYGGSADESAPGSLVPFTNIVQLTDGKYIMAGYTYSTDDDVVGNTSTSATDDNYWLVKLYGCPVYTTIHDTICNGGTYTFNSMTLDTTGTYYDTLVAANNCDSIVTLELFERPVISTTINDTICHEGTYTFNATQLNTSGTYLDTLTTAGGCDSFITLELYVRPAIDTTINDTICHNETYTFNATQLNTSGTYMDTIAAANGCDSVITLELYVRAAPGPVVTATGVSLSTGTFTSYQWLLNGNPVNGATNQNYTATQNGDYSVAIIDANGCKDTSAVHTVTELKVSNTLLASDINIFPNPVNNRINVSFPYTSGAITIAIYSIDGQLLLSREYSNTTKAAIDFDNYSAGVYTLKVTTANGEAVIKKLVKY